MIKRNILLGAVLVAVMMTGCAGSNETKNTNTTTADAQQTDVNETSSEETKPDDAQQEEPDVFYESYLNDVNWGEEKDLTGLTIYQSDCTLPIDEAKLELFAPYSLNEQMGELAGYSKEDIENMDGKMESFADFIGKATNVPNYSTYYLIDSVANSDITGPSITINSYTDENMSPKDAFETDNWHITAYTKKDFVDRSLVDISEDTTDDCLAQAIIDKFGKPTYVTTDGQGFSDIGSTRTLTLNEDCKKAEYDFVYEREEYVLKIEIKEGNRDKHYSALDQVIYYTKTEWEAEKQYLTDNNMKIVEIPME